MESKRFSLNKEDVLSIVKGALIAMVGAGLTYALQTLPNVDFGEMTPLMVAIFSIIINALRKYTQGIEK